MSDEKEIDTESEEEDEDFSASEDEWLPTKKDSKKNSRKTSQDASSAGEDEDDDYVSEDSSDLDDFEEVPKKGGTSSRKRSAPKASPKRAPQAGNKRKRLSPGLRDRLYKQYKSDLLKEVAPVRAPLNSSVSDILQKCQFQRKPTAGGSQSKADDSDSSGDDHLVDPDKLDLRSTFFNKTETTDSGPPQFDVNAGMRLSDSDDDDDDGEQRGDEGGPTGEKSLPASIPKQAADKLISHINQQSGEYMNFHNLDQFTAKVEEAKKILKSYQQKTAARDKAELEADGSAVRSSRSERESVSNLLALGETDAGVSPRKAQSNASSESEWEEVEGAGEEGEEKLENKPNPQQQDPNWQVTIEMDTAQSRRKRREELEMELYIKRQINKVKRANQLNYHKSSVLCAVAIGQHLNRTVGGGRLQALLMSIMQGKAYAPKAKWDEKAVQSLADWFKGEFSLQSNDFMAPRTGCGLGFALALAVYTRRALCRRDYILLFLACLRLAGARARIVLSANVPSKRPAMNDLCPMSKRKVKENVDKSPSVAVKVAKSVEKEPKLKENATGEEPPIPSTTVPEEVRMEQKPATLTPTKENPSEPVSKPTKKPKQIAVPRRTTRKALATLNIPQLDGGDDDDDQMEATENFLPLRRSLRSKSASAVPVPVQSPGLSPFTKRKSNTPAAANASAPKLTRTIATRKRQLFATQTEPQNLAVGPEPVKRTTVTTRSSSRQKATKQKEAKEPGRTVAAKGQKVERKVIRPGSPSEDEAFELKRPKGHKSVDTSIDQRTAAGVKESCKEMMTDLRVKNNGKVPVVVLSTCLNGSIDRKVLSSDSSEDEPDQKRKQTTGKRNLEGARGAPAKASQPKRATKKKRKASTTDDSGDDSDFELRKDSSNRSKKNTSASSSKPKKSPAARRAKAGERQIGGDKTDIWIEFYCEKSKRWITFDVSSGRVDCVDYIVRNAATSPISYVFAWDNESRLKDITARYVQNWNTACRMLRVEQPWLDKTLASLVGPKTDRDLLEDKELNKLDADKPLPKTIGELKNHPLYALRRHLLKFEALYPAEPTTLGFIRGEAIYPRECVHTLQTREKWYKQGRVVRPFETAYKVVRCWKYDRPTNTWLGDQPCDIFGHWQTDEYDPPTAENGIVPRNEYGNVELFTDKMLPKGTVHLKLPGLNKVCKRLQIDCAPALTGFDMAKMRVVPVYEGFVVCQEFAEQAVEEWYKEMEQEERREQEKMEKRVYGNWKRLLKGLLVRRKLQNKYNFDSLA